MKKNIVLIFLFLNIGLSQAQVKLCLDSSLKKAYVKKYGFHEGLMCLPFYCDPFCATPYKKNDTLGLCGKYVFVDTGFRVKINPGFDLPCFFEPRFNEGLCAVSMDGKIVFIDTLGQVKIKTDLLACSANKNRVTGFNEGKCKIYKGSGTIRNFYDVYYIDLQGKRIRPLIAVNVKLKPLPEIIAAVEQKRDSIAAQSETETVVIQPVFELPKVMPRGRYPISPELAEKILDKRSHQDNRLLLYFECGQYQLENMAEEDTSYCGKFVFTDTFFNVRISGGFTLPCAFEPEFSEGLCAVAKEGYLVYIDTNGIVKINTGLKACDTVFNKASTFKNGIATLYIGDKLTKGLYSTIAINTSGERVRLLEFDELDLAEKKLGLFKNLTLDECTNCFVGKGKTNGLWFLVEKSGKIRKKLDLK